MGFFIKLLSFSRNLEAYIDNSWCVKRNGLIYFIKNAHKNNGVVFVHCWFGMSRSVCIVLTYMVIVLDLEFNVAYIHIKNLRPIMDV